MNMSTFYGEVKLLTQGSQYLHHSCIVLVVEITELNYHIMRECYWQWVLMSGIRKKSLTRLRLCLTTTNVLQSILIYRKTLTTTQHFFK